ncbi:TetR/AcrR family transcriptional regulator [Lentilactobacillus sp. Marseille-Q4993]|uniref:TetR/AcrR family transcriptional regulator n=1 Tax=Lentilactobacillus sp. Marseille-Q4993 TaxID=3039492 RepID=UPI0024BD2C02|nr:TetR/AcrR family transcriptional regulator [Lentilactobacillus sp. Marseille-Q4993]
MNFLTNQEKENKANQIAVAALGLFNTNQFTQISMNMIASKAGVSKGTLFNYFKTKENVFMYLLLTGYQQYFAELITRLDKSPVHSWDTVTEFIQTTTAELVISHGTLLRLNSLRQPILEVNADQDQTISERKRLYQVNEELGQKIHDQFTEITVSDASHLFVIQSAIISGLMNLSGLSDFNRQPVANFNDFDIDIKTESVQLMTDYLNGFAERNGIE